MKVIVEAKPSETVSIVSEGQELRFSEKELVEALVGSWYSSWQKQKIPPKREERRGGL